MRLLFCSEFFYPEIGGVEKHMNILSDYFNKKYEVHIATTFNNLRTKEQISKYKIHQFDISGNFVKGYKGKINEYQNFLLNSNFDLILFYAAQQWTFDLSLEILENIKSKKIFLPCGLSKINNILYKPYFYLLKKKINNFDRIITFSKSYQDYIFCKNIYKKKINVIYNGADKTRNYRIENFINKKFLLKKNYITLLSIGSLKFMKGSDLAINVLNKLSNKNTVLIIICQKIYYNLYYLYLKLLILKLHIFSKKKVIILENLNQKIKNRIFSRCHYFIHTSRLECSPLVMFEALSHNKIFFGKDVGNAKEIISDCKVGFVSNSLEEIAKNIDKSILKKDHSNSKLKNIINNHFNKKFNWKIIMLQYEKIINKLIT